MREIEEERNRGFDPLADMFFTLAAMALLAAALALGAGAKNADGLTIVVSARGVSLADRSIPLSALQDDAALRERLARARDAGEIVALQIAPDGLETAFALEPMLGGAKIRQTRLLSSPPLKFESVAP